MSSEPRVAAVASETGELPRLLALEARLRARRREAEAEAARIVAAAEEQAGAVRRQVADEQAALEVRLRAEVAREVRERIAALEREADAVVAAYAAIAPDAVDRLARDVARAVVLGTALEETP